MKTEIDLIMEDFSIEDQLGSIVNRAAIIVKKRLHAMLNEAGYDITPEEFSLLSRLWENDGISQKELVEKTLKDKTWVARLLGGLVEKAYVSKKADDADRRNYILCLTAEGKAARRIIIPIVNQLMKEATEGISRSEIDVTKMVLNKVFSNLNKTDLDGMAVK